MALVILPCDLPHWSTLQRQLKSLLHCSDAKELIDVMFQVHYMTSTATGLDPDEPEKPELSNFTGLRSFLENAPAECRSHIIKETIPFLVRRALDLKNLKPPGGVHFSLQQQPDSLQYKRSFVASLLAHAFFSTFPKRTLKTHPTLQDFNFAHFFQHLEQTCQQSKLLSFFYYFDILETQNDEEMVTLSRQVLNGKQWLTIEDWMDNKTPLCNLIIRHEGYLEDAATQCLEVCFSSSRLGGNVLHDGTSMECINFFTMPEMIFILSSIEALEDNEALLVKDVLRISSIKNPRKCAFLNKFQQPKKVSVCCMDAENYTRLPLGQLAEDNLLRELNKALIGFRQGKPLPQKTNNRSVFQRRLSPIGESCGSNQSTKCSKDESPPKKLDSPDRKNSWLRPITNKDSQSRRGRFIILGSSGECLPVSRHDMFLAGAREMLQTTARPISKSDSMYSSAEADIYLDERTIRADFNGKDDVDEDDSDDDVFHSARTSIDFDREDVLKDYSRSDEGYPRPNTIDYSSYSLEEPTSFAERLKEALIRGATTYSSSDDSSYAVGISVNGSGDVLDVRCRRGTSTGFLLEEESLDDGFYQDSVEDPAQQHHSDTYSFTSNSGDSADIYERFSLWLTRVQQDNVEDVLTTKETVVSALKRAFSDSYVIDDRMEITSRFSAVVRSLSLELVKRNPKLAARMCTLLSEKDEIPEKTLSPSKDGLLPVATGNWGCGSSCGGDQQVKLALQWLAASSSGLPSLIYYTCHHHRLVKVDTVRRVLTDRRCSVGQLTSALLQFAQNTLNDPSYHTCLFDLLLGPLQG